MAIIRNLTVSAIPLNDLGGITIPASADFDLSDEFINEQQIQESADLIAAINAGDIVFLDGQGNPLSQQESLNVLESSKASLAIRYNTTDDVFEGFYNTSWVPFTHKNSPYISLNAPQIIKVHPVAGSGDFTSISAAVASITDASDIKPYVVLVGPGVYTEPVIITKDYVSIIGSSIATTIVEPDGNHNIFTASTYGEVSFMNVINAPTGYWAFDISDCGDYFQLHKVSIVNCHGGIKCAAPTIESFIYFEYVDISGDYVYGLEVNGDTLGQNIIVNAENFYLLPTTSNTIWGVYVYGPKAELHLLSGNSNHQDAVASGIGLLISDGPVVGIATMGFEYWAEGIKIDNLGTNPSILGCSAIIFYECTTNLNIDNPLSAGSYNGDIEYPKTYIDPDSLFYITGKDSNIITVAKKGGDFTSIKDAITAVSVLATSTNRYTISVGPGIFNEDQITMYPYVSIDGAGSEITQISPNNVNQNFILASNDSTIQDVLITGVTGAGYTALYFKNTTTTAKQCDLFRVVFGENDINCKVESTTGNSAWLFMNACTWGGAYDYDKGIVCTSAGGTARVSVRNSNSIPRSSSPYPSKFLELHGTGAYFDAVACRFPVAATQQAGTVGMHVYDGADFFAIGSTVCMWGTGIWAENTGAASNLVAANMGCDTSIQDLQIDHPGTTGSFTGLANRAGTYVNPSSLFVTNYVDNDANETILSGDIYLGATHSTLSNVTALIIEGGTMGLIDGGELSINTGFVVNIAAGMGYAQDNTDVYSFKLEWSADTITVPANNSYYVYYDNTGTKQTSASLPNVVKNIILGRVFTNASGVVYIDPTPYRAHHAGNYLNRFNREALGPVYVTGSLVTENGTALNLDVGSGQYYVSQNQFNPVGGTGITFEHFYHSSGSWTHGPVAVVSNTQYDNGTNLTNLTAGYYTKHTLYVVGDSTLEKYLLVHGAAEYSTLVDVEGASLPAPPPSFIGGVAPIASIIVQEGNANIVEVQDIRPVIGFKATGVSASATHGNLLGLSADDHTQYLLVNGTRAMAGALNLNTNNITNAGTVNGVTITAHASRHLPNGADALTTAAPSAGLTPSSTNAEGIANSIARSDHSHAITGFQQTDATLTALAAYNTNGLLTQTAADTFTGRTITGTVDQISVSNGNGVSGNPTVAIASTYAGQSTITTLGTIGTGTWNATEISTSKGGTGLTTIGTTNQILGVNTGATGLEYKTLVAGANITITPAAGSLTIASTGGGGAPAGANTNIQYNNSGVFGAEANLSYDSTLDLLTLYGAGAAQSRLAILNAATSITAGQENKSALYIEVNGDATFEGIRTYFKRSAAGISGWITYHYDGSTPNIRITDEDDDPPYIQFSTIGTGTYDAPQYVNYFGSRGPTAGVTTGFEWRVGGTTAATLDSNFFRQPTGTTAQRPGAPTTGMTRYNTTTNREEVYGPSNWVANIGTIDKSVVDAVITTAGPNNTYSFSVPGGTLGTDGILRLKLAGLWANASGTTRTVTIAVSYGGTTMYSDVSATLATGTDCGWNMEFNLIANNSASAQKLVGNIFIGSTGATTTGGAGDLSTDEIQASAQIVGANAALNSANAQTLNVTVTFSGTGITWTKYYHTLELL